MIYTIKIMTRLIGKIFSIKVFIKYFIATVTWQFENQKKKD